MTRFLKFGHKLSISSSKETATLAGLCQADARSTLGKNIRNIAIETCKDPRWSSYYEYRGSFRKNLVPEEDTWRIPLLGTLLEERRVMKIMDEDTENIQELIDSLCSS